MPDACCSNEGPLVGRAEIKDEMALCPDKVTIEAG